MFLQLSVKESRKGLFIARRHNRRVPHFFLLSDVLTYPLTLGDFLHEDVNA